MTRKNNPVSPRQKQKRDNGKGNYLGFAVAFGVVALLNLIQIVVFLVYVASLRG